MAEVINVPVANGVPPIPAGAENATQGQGFNPNAQTKPPAAHDQNAGWVSQVPVAPAGVDAAEYAAFLEFKKTQATSAAKEVAQVKQEVTPPAYADPAAALKTITEGGSDDPVLKSLTSILISSGNGIDIQRAIGNALARGDATLIDRAYISEKGGANAQNLLNIAEGIVNRVQSATAELTQYAYSAAGGEAQWGAAIAAFNNSAPTHLKAVIGQMLNSGSPEGIKSATKTVVEFAQSSGLLTVQGQRFQSQGGAPTGQGLSKAEFQKLHSALKPHSPTYSDERAALMARRHAGRLAGL